MPTEHYRIIVGSDEGTHYYYDCGRIYTDRKYVDKKVSEIRRRGDTATVEVLALTMDKEIQDESGRSAGC